jgi:S-DNA-T family DNA segregation ATPase FtsK/SpoIIIE
MASRRRSARTIGKFAAAFYGGGIHGAIGYLKHRYRWFLPTHWWHAAKTNPIKAFSLATFVVLWKETGHGILALALTGPVVAAGITAWFWYRARRTGLTVKEAARQLRLQKRVKARWTKACIAGGIVSQTQRRGRYDVTLIPPLTNIKTDKGDVTARIYTGQYAIPSTDVSKNLVRIAETVGCREVTMRTAGSGVIDLRFCWSNPLEKVVKPAHLPVAPKGMIPFGVTDSGEAICIPVINKDGETEFRSLLIGGVSGSGKSSALWAILDGFIINDVPVELRVSDASGGVELAELGKAMEQNLGSDRFRVTRYGETKAETDAIIKEMLADMYIRLASMKAAGVRKHKPTPQEPLVILVIDELLLIKALLKLGADSDMGQMLSVCRKAGYGVIACTVLAEKATLGECRELFPFRMAFRMNTRPQTTTILGDDQAEMGPAHTIPRDQQGVGYTYDQATDTMRKFRAVHITDLQAKQIAMGVAPDGLENYGKEPPEPERMVALYRLNTYPNADGSRKRLYIGISDDPARRFAEHRRDKKFAKEVDWGDAAKNLDWYTSRTGALDAEKAAILSELPPHNDQHNRDNPARDLDELVSA